jgi:hypothetical protein
MNDAMRRISALAAAAAVLVPAQAALAGDPEPRPSKLAADQATLPPGQVMKETFTPGGGIVQMYYRCEPGVSGRIALFEESRNGALANRVMLCDNKVHRVRNVPVEIGREHAVELSVVDPGFAGYSVWGRR